MRTIYSRFTGPRALVVGAVALAVVAASLALFNAPDVRADGGDEGYLGVYMQRLTSDVRKGLDLDVDEGVLISGVDEDGPAALAGIEDGDVIISFNGKEVDSPRDLRRAVAKVSPGEKVDVELIRDGKKQTIEVTVGERPDDIEVWFDDGMNRFRNHHWFGDLDGTFAGVMGGKRLGVQATELNEDLSGYFDTGEGVLVLDVDDESVASEAGLKAGDVIQEIDGEKIESVRDVRHIVNGFDEGDEFEISVMRKGKKQALTATMDDQGSVFAMRHFDKPKFRKHHAPRVRVERLDRDLREELEELREELEELKEEMRREAD